VRSSSTHLDQSSLAQRSGRGSLALLLLILVALAVPKIVLSINSRLPGIDGGYYTEVAGHVRDGEGLVTNVSLYHQGFESFPHPTSVSPLWPLVYGYTARVFPIQSVGIWLPTCFYFLALIFAYLFARRLLPEPFFPTSLPAFLPAHALVVLIGLHKEFFQFTSLPNTEGLAYTLLFAGLWRSLRCFERANLVAGLELSLWLGLMMLARGQLMIVAFALYPALLFGLFRSNNRRRYLSFITGSIVPCALLLGWHHSYVQSFLEDDSFGAMFRFDKARASSLLSAFDPILHVDGLWAYIADRSRGFLVAFDPTSNQGYSKSFGLFHYFLVVGLIAGVASSARLFNERKLWLDRLRGSSAAPWIFLGLLALAGFFSIHTIHKSYYVEWNFARRQALTAAFLMFVSLVILMRHRNALLRIGSLLLMIASTGLGYANVVEFTVRQTVLADKHSANYNPQLVDWINRKRASKGKLTVALTAQEPQKTAYQTPGVGYHWIYWETLPDDVNRLADQTDLDYVIVGKEAKAWAFCRDGSDFGVHFRQVGRPVSGFEIFEPREGAHDSRNDSNTHRTRKNIRNQ
jgi:hypothetical protein